MAAASRISRSNCEESADTTDKHQPRSYVMLSAPGTTRTCDLGMTNSSISWVPSLTLV
jgi:hypothetical protein